MIRDATAADAEALARIQNRAIEGSTISLTTTPVDAANRAAWLAARQAGDWPVLVLEVGGAVAGYAALGPFRTGEGYAPTAEHSIHLAPEAQGRGHGRALMAALIARARARGLANIVGVITTENAGSEAFHAALGFRRVGLIPGCGTKFGRSLDIGFWLLALTAAPP